jgi:hypothetical protein
MGESLSGITSAGTGRGCVPGGRVVADKCRCGSLLGRPSSGLEGWQPIAGPRPGSEVRVVARYGDNPRDRRAERTRSGWVARGASIERPGVPIGWSRIGRCPAGRSHWVVPIVAGPR